MKNRKVSAVGPRDSSIILIGEAPGATEEREGLPFVGTAGRVLDGLLLEAGIKREDCYITNVHKYRPRNNDISTVSPEDLAGSVAELSEELSLLSPNIIVCCGATALKAVTDKVSIMKWRGSILDTKYGKVIGVIHPAAIARQWTYRPITACDFHRIAHESKHKSITIAKRKCVVMPTYEEAIQCLKELRTKEKVAFDIEVETSQISCIAFASSAHTAISIPLWFGTSGSFYSEEQELEIWKHIKLLLGDTNVKKIAQNAQYDMTILEDLYGVPTKNLWLDTMIAFHALYPELPKSLANLTSLYTDVPYYKFQRMTEDMTEFFRYNAMDAMVTYEIADKLYTELESAKLVDFYYEHMHSLIEPLMSMTKKGVRIACALKKGAITSYRSDIEKLSVRLVEEVGHPLNPNSNKQMIAWLYDELKLPKKYRRRIGTRTVTADEEALSELAAVYEIPAIKTILEIRNKKKILSTYLEIKYDKEEDGQERARTSYLITGTETGRLASRKTVYRTGTNLQNVPKGIARQIFIPDDGKLFINADLSQAEARVVAYLAGELPLISILNSGGDIHKRNAAAIFRKPEAEVTTKERTLAKRVVHASNYGMGPGTFAKTTGISMQEAKRLLNQYFATYPKIKLWHMQISAHLKRTRKLRTPLGRCRTFFNGWSDSLRKEAYAYIPQSTVADILNIGLRRVYDYYRETDVDLLLQIHDAVLVQAPREKVDEVCKKLVELLGVPITINGRRLSIPVDISVGENWNDMKEVT